MLRITTGDSGTIEGAVAANLTGATAVVHIKNGTDTLTKTATIGDPTAGEWAFDYDDTDFTRNGVAYLEVEVTFSNGQVQTFAYEANGRDRLAVAVRSQYA